MGYLYLNSMMEIFFLWAGKIYSLGVSYVWTIFIFNKIRGVSFLIFFFGYYLLIAPTLSWGDIEAISQMRRNFQISFGEASDKELKQFLENKNNRMFIEGMVNQINYGRELDLFIVGKPNKLPDIRKEVFSIFFNKTIFGILKIYADKAQLSWLGPTITTLGVSLTISNGVKVFIMFSDALAYRDSKFVIWEYNKKRKESDDLESIFNDFYNENQEQINMIIRLSKPWSLVKPVITNQDKINFMYFLELSYQSLQLYQDNNRREDIKKFIFRTITEKHPKEKIEDYLPPEGINLIYKEISGRGIAGINISEESISKRKAKDVKKLIYTLPMCDDECLIYTLPMCDDLYFVIGNYLKEVGIDCWEYNPPVTIFKLPLEIQETWTENPTMSTKVYLGKPKRVKIKFTVKGKEIIKTPMGSLNCWKIEEIRYDYSGKVFRKSTSWWAKNYGKIRFAFSFPQGHQADWLLVSTKKK